MTQVSPGSDKTLKGLEAIQFTLLKSIQAGIMITIGCVAYLSCENRYLGAFLFATALCAICNMSMALFTGKVWNTNTKSEFFFLMLSGLGNFVGCVITGPWIRIALPGITEKANAISQAKLEQPYFAVFLLAMLCGMLMTIAVRTFKKQDGFGKYVGIFTCVPTFIICGFEHSIADMAYFSIASSTTFWESIMFLLLVMFGNTIGGLFFKT